MDTLKEYFFDFIERLLDFFKEYIGLIFTIIILSGVMILLISAIIPDTESNNFDDLSDTCTWVALGEYNDTTVDFRLQRCVVPDDICYVSSGGGVDCKWEEDK